MLVNACGIALIMVTEHPDGKIELPDGAVENLRAARQQFELVHDNLERIETANREHPALQHFALRFAPTLVLFHNHGGDIRRMKDDFVRWSRRTEPELLGMRNPPLPQ